MKKAPVDKQSKQFVEADKAESSVINRLKRDAAAATEEGDLTQAEKFAQAARDLGADQDEEAFKGVLRKLAKAKT